MIQLMIVDILLWRIIVIREIIKEKQLPPFKSRKEMLDILQREEYGYMPPPPDKISFDVTDKYIKFFCAGKAISKKIDITVSVSGKSFTFPCYASIPTKEGKHPFFVCINFSDAVVDRFIPTEEIIDSGYAVLSFYHNDVTKDNADFTDGLAEVFYEAGIRSSDTDPGKIALWAWAAQRVMDYAETVDSLDKDRAVVCGHSRLGKTALLAAATDERFKMAYSNNSGCSGAAITRGKQGERVYNIYKVFPFWFCKNYQKYVDNEDEMPFDQHYLAAAIAPRPLYVASAEKDIWADPASEMLTCAAVSEVYEKYGLDGFISEDRLPRVGDEFHEGCVGYHLRAGEHYMGREDWQKVIRFINRHFEK